MGPAARSDYFPELNASSCPLSLEGDIRAERSTISLFRCRKLTSVAGLVAFTGGAVTSVEWCPDCPGVFAVAPRPPPPPSDGDIASSPGICYIQLWRVERNCESALCFAVIKHDGLFTLSLKWAPMDPHLPSVSMLVVAFANGTARLFLLRRDLLRTLKQSTDTPILLECPYLDIAKPAKEENREGVVSSAVPRRVAWSPDGSSLTIGFLNGEITLYSVSRSRLSQLHGTQTTSSLILEEECLEKKWCIKCHDGAITYLEWLSSDLLTSAGTDGYIFIRDVREPIVAIEKIFESYAWPTAVSKLSRSGTDLVISYDTGLLKFVRLRGKARPQETPSQDLSVVSNCRLLTCSLRSVAISREPCWGEPRDDVEEELANLPRRGRSPLLLYVASSNGIILEIDMRIPPSVSLNGRVRIDGKDVTVFARWQGRKSADIAGTESVSCDTKLRKNSAKITRSSSVDSDLERTSEKEQCGGDSDGGNADTSEGLTLNIPTESSRKQAGNRWYPPPDGKYYVGRDYDRGLVMTKVVVDDINKVIAIGTAGGFVIVTSLRSTTFPSHLHCKHGGDASKELTQVEVALNAPSKCLEICSGKELQESNVASFASGSEAGVKSLACIRMEEREQKRRAREAEVQRRRLEREKKKEEMKRKHEETKRKHEENIRLVEAALEARRQKVLQQREASTPRKAASRTVMTPTEHVGNSSDRASVGTICNSRQNRLENTNDGAGDPG